MKVLEEIIKIEATYDSINVFNKIRSQLANRVNGQVVRFVVNKSDSQHFECELGILDAPGKSDIFEFQKRSFENCQEFNPVLIIPTGIGCEIGGHAGDAAPTARMLAKCCDNLILHPNVVNGSDINEIPENAIYVEGSQLSQLMMGTVGLRKVRKNRILTLIDQHQSTIFTNSAINSVNAAVASYGLEATEIVVLDSGFSMSAVTSATGRASGKVNGLLEIFKILDNRVGEFDAVAITSQINIEPEKYGEYFLSSGDLVNPWGGIESLLTHSIALNYKVPVAHAPMYESENFAAWDCGVVDPRMAAEVISVSFMQCILKGLMKSPKMVGPSQFSAADVISAENVSCLITPDGCIGLPLLAALHQGIPVIAVTENTNIMQNDLDRFPWRPGQFIRVRSYLEAAGVMQAMRAGLSLESLKRPLHQVPISSHTFKLNKAVPPCSADTGDEQFQVS